MQLEQVVPWGRSFEEYISMFELDAEMLPRSILGCADGPSSFNAGATRRSVRCTSVDPLFQFSASQIASRIDAVKSTIAEQLRENRDDYVWEWFQSVDMAIEARLGAMAQFLEDYDSGSNSGRYQNAALPHLPFADQQFELALCSHFLFLYTDHFDEKFHATSVLELCRVAREVRIFPLLSLDSSQSRHLEAVLSVSAEHGFSAQIVPTSYEFQKGASQMLKITRKVGT